jgi:hypothetical protein
MVQWRAAWESARGLEVGRKEKVDGVWLEVVEVKEDRGG